MALGLAGCLTVSPQQRLNHAGNVSYANGNYKTAIEDYHLAVVKARENNDKQYEAIAMYGLGRAYGNTCMYSKSVKWFLNSIALRKSIPDTDIAYLSQNHLELARLHKAHNKNSKANEQFEMAIPLLDALNMQENDPISYAYMLKGYSSTLEKAGNIEKAKEIKSLIKKLRENNPNKRAGFVSFPYPTNCSG